MRVTIAVIALIVLAQVALAAEPGTTTLQPTKNPAGGDASKGQTILTPSGNAAPSQPTKTVTTTTTTQTTCCCQKQVTGCSTQCAVAACPKPEYVQPEITQKVQCASPCAVKDNKCACPEHVQPEIAAKPACPCAAADKPCGCSNIVGAHVKPETKNAHVKPEVVDKHPCPCAVTNVKPCGCAASFLELPGNF